MRTINEDKIKKKEQRRNKFEQMSAERTNFWRKEIERDVTICKLIVKFCVAEFMRLEQGGCIRDKRARCFARTRQ
jgi:hypothetical protein